MPTVSNAKPPLVSLPTIPQWMARYLPESFRPIPPKPEPSVWERFWPYVAVVAFLCVFAVVWGRYGLSLRAVMNRLMTPLHHGKTSAMLVLLRRRLTAAYDEERMALRKTTKMVAGEPLTSPAASLTSPAMISVVHPDTMLQEYYGFKAVLDAQKACMKLDQANLEGMRSGGTGKDKAADAALNLPNVGTVAELLLSGIPTARRSIPLWMPATRADDGYFLTSLALPSSMLNMMILRQAQLPAPFLQVARLGMAYHNICKYRESRLGDVRGSEVNRDGYASHNTNDRHDRSLQDLWTVSLCPESYARVGPHWAQLGFSTNDPITDLRDGNLYALDDFAHFARVNIAAHREMMQYTAAKKAAASNMSLSGLVDTFSEASASFLISVMLTRLPKAFQGPEEDNWVDAADYDDGGIRGGGEMASPKLTEEGTGVYDAVRDGKWATVTKGDSASRALESYASRTRDGSCLHFTPTMVRFLYGGAAAVSMFASGDKTFSSIPRDKLSTKPTPDDERVMRHRLRQLHSCLLKAYFQLWKRDEPLSSEMFLLNTFYPESGRIADEYLRGILG